MGILWFRDCAGRDGRARGILPGKTLGDGVFERKSPAPKVFNEDCIILNQKQMMGPSREVVLLLQLTSGYLLDG